MICKIDLIQVIHTLDWTKSLALDMACFVVANVTSDVLLIGYFLRPLSEIDALHDAVDLEDGLLSLPCTKEQATPESGNTLRTWIEMWTCSTYRIKNAVRRNSSE
jgi:hypothetical protein